MLRKKSRKTLVKKCQTAENFEKLVRRITFLIVGSVLLITVATVGVVGYTFYRINMIVTEVSEPLAPLVPLVRGITDPLQGAGKSNKTVLSQDRAEAFRQLKDKTFDQARSTLKRGRSGLSKIERYSQQQTEKIENSLEQLSKWWGSKKNQLKEGVL